MYVKFISNTPSPWLTRISLTLLPTVSITMRNDQIQANLTLFFLFYRYLNQRMISYDEAFHVEPLMSPDNGLGLKWPVGTILSVSKTNSISHDGNYTCAPSTGVISDSVLVHIIDDGKIPPAAVYGDSSKAAGLKINTTHYFPGVLLYVMSQLLSTLLSSNAEI